MVSVGDDVKAMPGTGHLPPAETPNSPLRAGGQSACGQRPRLERTNEPDPYPAKSEPRPGDAHRKRFVIERLYEEEKREALVGR